VIDNRYFTYIKPGKERNSPTYAANAAFLATKKAAETAGAPPVINLTLGELDISPSNRFLERSRKRAAVLVSENPLYQLAGEPGGDKDGSDERCGGCNYPPAKGTPEFRRAAAWKFAEENGYPKDSVNLEDIAVLPGGKGTLNGIGSCFDKGDEVLVAGPGWVTNYDFWRDGVNIVEVDTSGRGLMTPDQLAQALTDHPNVKAVLINDPCNPTGARYTPEEREAFMAIVNQHRASGHKDLIVVADDPYGALTYNGATMKRGPEEKKLFGDGGMVIANSVSKVYGRPDMRVGWAVSKNKALIDNIVAYIQKSGASVPVDKQNQAQLLVLFGDAFIEETKARIEKRGTLLANKINEIPGLSMEKPQGAIYGWLNLSGLQGKTIPAESTLNKKEIVLDDPSKAAEFLRQVAGVATVDGPPFYAPQSPAAKDNGWFVRVVLTAEETLEKACDRIGEAVGQLKGNWETRTGEKPARAVGI
jgi:aspartate aminotransferase